MAQNPDVRISRSLLVASVLVVAVFFAFVGFVTREPGCGVTVAGLELPWPCSWAYWWTR